MEINGKEGVRCFVALELPREAINYIRQLQKTLEKQNLFTGKFTEAENLHLTLKFLGEIEEERMEEIRKKLREIKMQSFEARLGGVGVFSKKFPKNKKFFVSQNSKRKEEFSDIKIIWLKLDGKGIFELQKEIDEKLKEIFHPEERFMSHITIARVKNVPDRNKFLGYVKNLKTQKIKFKVDKFFLKKSTLKPEGPVYEDIEELLFLERKESSKEKN